MIHIIRKGLLTLMNDSWKTWGFINELIGRNKDQKISLVSDNGNRVNDVKLPNYVNDYFVSSVQNLTSVFDEDISVEAVSNVNSARNSFYLAPTDFTEIVNVMCNLPNKGNNMVDIKPNILREVSRYVVPVLVYLFNLCTSLGVYPDKLKIGRVSPIFKSGSTENVSNYRPITNLPIINKIFEKLTFNRIDKYIHKNKILSDLQYGFLKNTCTTF